MAHERYRVTDRYLPVEAERRLVVAGFEIEQRDPLVVWVGKCCDFDRSVTVAVDARRPHIRPVEAESRVGQQQSVRAVADALGDMVEPY